MSNIKKTAKITTTKITVILFATLILHNNALAQESAQEIAVSLESPGAQTALSPMTLNLREALNKTLNYYTLENNEFYNKALAPAMSLDLNKSDADRTYELNNKISSEINSVLSAFDNSSEDKKPEAVLNVIKNIDTNMRSTVAAHIKFTDGKPGAGTARTILMLEKKNHLTPEKILKVISSYKHSAKPNDHVYEYENPQDLTSGNMKFTKGTDTSWQEPQAHGPFTVAKDYVLKKCRQLFGWRCSTTLYHADSLSSPQGDIKYLFMANYDLNNNPDHQEFTDDKRSTNQTAGSTAIFVVKESAQWIIIYGIDSVLSNDKISFSSIIQAEFQKDFGRLSQRLITDLNVEPSVNNNINKIDVDEPNKQKIKFKEKVAKWFLKLKDKFN